MYRVMTVCTGNICRSPVAEYLLRRALEREGLQDDVAVESSATSRWEIGNGIDKRAGSRLDDEGIDTSGHRARQFEPEWFDTQDLILAMDIDHWEDLRELAPDPVAAEKVHMFREFIDESGQTDPLSTGIEDPWYGTGDDFTKTQAIIEEAIPSIIKYIRSQLPAAAAAS